ncbi:Acyl-[acyl-carrier-protein]--UDP-N-acetylglucosa mine O-acyltransferase [Mucinivorans hirudinis]|uniref:Acyl-[acyl-carrier-protein]--UDP-N-acetylglucosa mine O-acyltransferase n=1 Tax=Mucinivorans hirudinis TaxID=1433126 RepID=A0A060RBP9_9BACT|nr:Acyl-[acyl-carrier-protein]--UDP-N-acetylglucosa mine O-acyltransferase [Mucinivorans hirudinis]
MISPLAYIDPAAKIGEGVTIEPFAYIQGKVVIGDGCHIFQNASVMDGAILGKNCQVHSGAVVSGIPQDLKFRGEETTAVIGDNTVIRECATVNRGTAARGVTTVGRNCLLMAYAHVGHDCVVGDNVILVNCVALAGEVEVGDYAILSGHVGVHQFCRVGSHVMISGGTMVAQDIPHFAMVAHQPPSYVGINAIGLRRRGFTSEQITLIQDINRVIFQSGMRYSAACDKVEAEFQQSEIRDLIISFIRESKRGVCKPYRGISE